MLSVCLRTKHHRRLHSAHNIHVALLFSSPYIPSHLNQRPALEQTQRSADRILTVSLLSSLPSSKYDRSEPP